MDKIRIGIAGYGNLGRGVQLALGQNPDMRLVGVFTRRDPARVRTLLPARVERLENAVKFKDEIDVMILCGGSATDLPVQGPELLAHFNTVDSFDTHAKIPEYFTRMDGVGKASGKLAAISIGWDPGLFSLLRTYFFSVMPEGDSYTFWGRGVSQGHSDAVRRIPGVLNAVQYTIPVETALAAVRDGESPALTARQKHTRECYVAAEPGADKSQIERTIKEMPNYFADYDTTVHFVSQEELARDHAGIPHGGLVLRAGKSAAGSRFLGEFSLKLESNPEFTSGVLVAFARAVYRLHGEGKRGAATALDVPTAYLAPVEREELYKNFV